jgi:hypothetical protein
MRVLLPEGRKFLINPQTQRVFQERRIRRDPFGPLPQHPLQPPERGSGDSPDDNNGIRSEGGSRKPNSRADAVRTERTRLVLTTVAECWRTV